MADGCERQAASEAGQGGEGPGTEPGGSVAILDWNVWEKKDFEPILRS